MFVLFPAFVQKYVNLSGAWVEVPTLLFGVGAVAVAKNPEGSVHQLTVALQRAHYRMTHAGSGTAVGPPPGIGSGPPRPVEPSRTRPPVTATNEPTAEVSGT